MKHVSRLSGLLGLLGMVALAGCGGGGNSASSGPTQDSFGGGGGNVVAMTVQPGPADAGFQPFNQPQVSVKICNPTSGTCVTIGGILVDTGSYGLRVMNSALAGLTLPAMADPTVPTNSIKECLPFADGYAWGQVSLATVSIGGETTSGSLPIQVIDDSNPQPSVPSGCSSLGNNLGSVNALGANGILGVGVFASDCGSGCAQTPTPSGEIYYSCPSALTNCVPHSQPVADQVTNPVADFPVDNNGVILQLPVISASGATTASGYLVFGIGTESNNVLGSAHVVTANSQGSFTATFNGQTLASSFIDSGSNALFFNDSSLPTCSTAPDFYCPNATATLSATNQGQDGKTNQVTFTIANFDNINGMNFALDDVGGTAPPIPSFGPYFDWGLPFFFGRTTFFALEGANAGGTVGPYYAY